MDHTPDLSERAAAYERMVTTLRFLGETWRDRPDLETCAREASLSPAHFQREVTRWAGLSPKQLQGAMAHACAGSALKQGASVEEASFAADLSTPSRLHDLFIAHEGLAPGNVGREGEGVMLRLGTAPTPFGDAAFLIAPRGLAGLGFIDTSAASKIGFEHPGYSRDAVLAHFASRFPKAEVRLDDAEAARWAVRVFEPCAPVPLALYGSPFRRQVWRALMDIAPTETTSYGALADSLGRPKAARAVGTAVGANLLAWVIPCHRVLARDGRLHNYHWGVDRKRAMLTYEAVTRSG